MLCFFLICQKLAFRLKHMKMQKIAVLQEVNLVLGLWKVFEYSQNKFNVFKEVQTTYSKSLQVTEAYSCCNHKVIVNVTHITSKFHIKEKGFNGKSVQIIILNSLSSDLL